ncbi:anthrone oxygenase family protein [Kitasatospora sp. NPDC050463]|uniref:anthrone oxygenase family protein n=1 Tax=Kitasatospora sp. NPDC050463 TaxID=3155786 RepID=UPI0033D9414D
MRHDRTTLTSPAAAPAPAPGTAPVPAPGTVGDRGSRAAGPLLAVGTVATGLMAGLFFAFDVAVMPGLADSDDRTYVTAMQHINKAIENAAFGLVFVGALVATGLAAFLQYRAGRRATAIWAAAATALYLGALVVTATVNLPLNSELARAGDPSRIQDLAAVRAAFESSWATGNLVRTLLCTAGLAALVRALLLHGRAASRTVSAGFRDA